MPMRKVFVKDPAHDWRISVIHEGSLCGAGEDLMCADEAKQIQAHEPPKQLPITDVQKATSVKECR